MELLTFNFGEDLRRVRWGARLLSLLPIGFYLSLFLLNEDVRSEPNGALVLWGIVTAFLLISWRWEKAGGIMAMAGAPLLWIVVAANGILHVDFPVLLALAVGGMLALPYLVIGWLFYSLGNQAQIARPAGLAQSPGRSSGRNTRLSIFIIAALVAVALAAVVLFFLSTVIPGPRGERVVLEQQCGSVIAPERITDIGVPAPVTTPPTEPLPNSFKGYELYSYQTGGTWIFTLTAGLNRIRTFEEASAPYYEEGTGWMLEGVEDLKATLVQVPAGETITWCGFEMPERPVREEIQTTAGQLGLDLNIP